MKRTVLKELGDWAQKKDRKPLVIRGARQVGKTWVVREFARQSGLGLVEINFERHPEYANIFQKTSPDAVITALERQLGKKIHGEPSLLFLDEIQKAPQAFANLRWFYEEKPELPVVATGSLLDFVLECHEFSMPVGRISYLFMEPMSFKEFLTAQGEEIVVEYLESFPVTGTVEDVLHQKLKDLFRDYLLVGGLPGAVLSWTETHSPAAVAEIHQDLINTYLDDFNKYADRIPTERLHKIFQSVPRLLGKKFKYVRVDREERSTALRQALDKLCLARICHKVICSHGRGIPLSAEENENLFKVILLDVGLASAVLELVLQGNEKIDDLVLVNEGGIAEQVVGQMLRTAGPSYVSPNLHYYVREQKGAEAEIDYLFQLGTRIVPIEVKSGSTGHLRSLHQFMAERKLPLAIRLNTEKPSLVQVDLKTTKGEHANYKLLSLPLYFAGEIPRLIEKPLE